MRSWASHRCLWWLSLKLTASRICQIQSTPSGLYLMKWRVGGQNWRMLLSSIADRRMCQQPDTSETWWEIISTTPQLWLISHGWGRMVLDFAALQFFSFTSVSWRPWRQLPHLEQCGQGSCKDDWLAVEDEPNWNNHIHAWKNGVYHPHSASHSRCWFKLSQLRWHQSQKDKFDFFGFCCYYCSKKWMSGECLFSHQLVAYEILALSLCLM